MYRFIGMNVFCFCVFLKIFSSESLTMEDQLLNKITLEYFQDRSALLEMHTIKDHINPLCYLLSYPRSGNSWVRYCLEFLTHRPSCEALYCFIQAAPNLNTPFGLLYDIGIDLTLSPILKVHNFALYKYCFYTGADNELICVVRNYIDCIASHLFNDYTSISNELFFSELDNYMEVLCTYEAWPHKKMILYYEDILSCPEDFLLKCTSFFQSDIARAYELLENKELHKEQCLKIYEDYERVTKTKAKISNYYKEKVNHEEREKIKQYIFKNYPNIARKYLSRY
jgi:hypothetical protein